MNSGIAHHLYAKYAGAMAYIAVEASDGTPGIGSAFHVGEGVFVTARHVVENQRIVKVAVTEKACVRLKGEEAVGAREFIVEGNDKYPMHTVYAGEMKVHKGPFYHPNEHVDIAVLQVANIDDRMPFVRLGDHLDDWLGESDFILSEVIILGYPPIPLTNRPHLVAARAEVNAKVDIRGSDHVHFVLSAMPRGGFSGGLALTESEIALGVVTSSLLNNYKESELGFFTVITVEPIYVCLAEYKLLPVCQAEGWDDFWNMEKVAYFYDPARNPDAPQMVSICASLSIFNDGKIVYLEISCDDDADLLENAIRSVEDELVKCLPRRVGMRAGIVKVMLDTSNSQTGALLLRAFKGASSVFEAAGLTLA